MVIGVWMMHYRANDQKRKRLGARCFASVQKLQCALGSTSEGGDKGTWQISSKYQLGFGSEERVCTWIQGGYNIIVREKGETSRYIGMAPTVS
jgi:hypothetical protein